MTDEKNGNQAAEEPVEATEAEQTQDETVELSPEAQIAQLEASLLVAKSKQEEAEKLAGEAQARAHAEVQNLRKRLERDTDTARKFALERFVKDLIPVLDSFNLGLQSFSADEALKPAYDGMSLTQKQFLDVLKRFDVEEIAETGVPFSADVHEVVSMAPSDEPSNTVVQVMQKGYTLNDRLVRPAMVIVAS